MATALKSAASRSAPFKLAPHSLCLIDHPLVKTVVKVENAHVYGKLPNLSLVLEASSPARPDIQRLRRSSLAQVTPRLETLARNPGALLCIKKNSNYHHVASTFSTSEIMTMMMC